MKTLYKALVAAIVALGVGQSYAATVAASGNFLTTCQFGTITPGVLKMSGDGKTVASTAAVGGTSASVSLTMFGSPILVVTNPVATVPGGQVAPASTTVAAVGSNSTFSAYSGPLGTGVSSTLTGIAETVTIDQSAAFTNAISVAGDYILTSTMTCQ